MRVFTTIDRLKYLTQRMIVCCKAIVYLMNCGLLMIIIYWPLIRYVTHNKLDLQLKAAAEARALVLAKQVKEAEVAVAKAQADLQGSINVRIISINNCHDCMHIETYYHDSYRDLVKSYESLVTTFHSLFISRAIFFLSYPSWCVTHFYPLYCTVLCVRDYLLRPRSSPKCS